MSMNAAVVSYVHVMVIDGLFTSLDKFSHSVGFISIPNFVPCNTILQSPLIDRVLNVDAYLSSSSSSSFPSKTVDSFWEGLTVRELSSLREQFRRRVCDGISDEELRIIVQKVFASSGNLISSTLTTHMVFGGIPHSFFDYILLLSARFFGLKIKVFQEFPWCPYACIEFSDQLLPLLQKHDSLAEALPGRSETYSEQGLMLADNIIIHRKAFLSIYLNQFDHFVESADEVKYWLQNYLASDNHSLSATLQRQGIFRAFAYFQSPHVIACLRTMAWSLINSEQFLLDSLHKHLVSICEHQFNCELIGPDLSILVLPLPSEPECSMNPMCLEYSSSLDIVEAVIKLLPPGYILLIKEHPGMLGLEGISGHKFDPLIQYREKLDILIANTDNLYWYPLYPSPSHLLLLDSLPILYAVGTIGIEAYLMGKVVFPIATTLLSLLGHSKIGDEPHALLIHERNATGKSDCITRDFVEKRVQVLYSHLLPFSPVGIHNGLYSYSVESDIESGRRIVSFIDKWLLASN